MKNFIHNLADVDVAGQRLSKLRIANGRSVRECADAIGVSDAE